MRTYEPLDRSLEAFFADAATAPAPAGLAEAIVAGIARRRPRAAWHARLDDLWGAMPTKPRMAVAGRPSTAFVVVVALALLAAALVVGAALLLERDQPRIGASRVVYATGSMECQDLIEIDVRSGRSIVVLSCADSLLVDPSRHRAAVQGAGGLELIDLADGSRRPVPLAAGSSVRPVAWSPSGRWLHWVTCAPPASLCEGFIGAPGGTDRNPVPEPTDGGYSGSFLWSADERHFFVWDDAGVHVAAGDGSGFALSAWPSLPYDISPDGRSGAFQEGTRLGPNNDQLVGDLALVDALGSRRVITAYPDGTFVQAAAWSRDGERIAVITTDPGTELAPNPAPRPLLRVLTLAGVEVSSIGLPDRFARMGCGDDAGALAWSPDDTRILVDGPRCLPRGEPGVEPAPVVVELQTGATLPLGTLQQASWSPDGVRIVGTERSAAGAIGIVVWNVFTGERQLLGIVEGELWSVPVWAP